MESAEKTPHRRKTPWVIGTIMVVSLAMLFILQASNLWKDLAIESSSDVILLYALSSLNFFAFVIFGFIFLRSIIKLVRERRTFELGAQIKTRLLIYFFAISLLPIIAMAVFSYLFMNRALERWFTQIPENVMLEARKVQNQSIADRFARLDESARMLAASIGDDRPTATELALLASEGKLAHISVVSAGSLVDAAYEREASAAEKSEIARISSAARLGALSDPTFRDGRGFDVAVADMTDGRKLIVIPEPLDERSVSHIVENSIFEFDRLKQKQVVIRQIGLLTLGVLTFLLIFASTWIAFYVARGITQPIKALAEGADEIARGNLGHRVDVLAEDELAILVSTFNDMSAKLESNSLELEQRRRYIETVLETLPTGVMSFDADNRVSTINRAAVNILRLPDNTPSKRSVSDTFPSEADSDIVIRILSRARRVGHAADQLKLSAGSENGGFKRDDEVTVALTASKLPSDDGVVLVIEDLSDLISAQRSSAWQEVARRMAHEIKNPLTPIQLSAERIAKRFSGQWSVDGGQLATGSFVSESTGTILREVQSLKAMVDEFSRFARLPKARLESWDVNEVIRQATALYDGRKEVEIDVRLAEDLPAAIIDDEQLKRVFVNLIDNAIEAAGEQERRRVTITSRLESARDLIVIEVGDNGRGIDPADYAKLFQPYFSTKGRGTGLGLAIVHRIITEHHGKIKAVPNQPNGAKFIVELPTPA